MNRIIRFIQQHPVYFLGYGITTVTYFSRYVHQLQYDFMAQAAIAVLSCFIGLFSWLYVAARVINAWCN